jgi:hypothetical protein
MEPAPEHPIGPLGRLSGSPAPALSPGVYATRGSTSSYARARLGPVLFRRACAGQPIELAEALTARHRTLGVAGQSPRMTDSGVTIVPKRPPHVDGK